MAFSDKPEESKRGNVENLFGGRQDEEDIQNKKESIPLTRMNEGDENTLLPGSPAKISFQDPSNQNRFHDAEISLKVRSAHYDPQIRFHCSQ